MSLELQRCTRCGYVPGFRRIACPRCLGALEPFEGSGRGTVQTYTVIHRPHDRAFEPHLPIVMAVIELEDGPEVISTIVGENRLETSIGAGVAVATGGGRWSALPQFELR